MNPESSPALPTAALARRALARAAASAAFVYGYPLIESLRTCRLQTSRGSAAAWRAGIDQLHPAERPSTDRDRDVVTPANDLLYTTGWVHLAEGPRLLTVPAAQRHPGRYFVLALYDAYTENFENLGPRNCSAEGETVVLLGPQGELPAALAGHRVVRAPTNLVWVIGRILAGDESDWPAARALQAEVGLAPAPGTPSGHRPAAVEQWQGPPVDTMAAVFEQAAPTAEAIAQAAEAFYANLCRGLADAPGRVEDRALVAWFSHAGIVPGQPFALAALEPLQREGLLEGFGEAVALVGHAARSRRAKPWVLAARAGRYGNDMLTRALTAYIGLGALATDEALYGAGHFDAQQQPLTGAKRYRLHFPAGELPPAQAFWSVTLYDADRFLYANPLRRHAIGDRTPGLVFAPDGGLTLDIAHQAPTTADGQASTHNWLPAPSGPFYLILRLYHPRDGVRSWRIPALQPLEA